MSKANEERILTKGYVFLADSYYDGEGERKNLIGNLLMTCHRDVLWANHTLDTDIKPHTHVLWREDYSTSISTVAARYNHPARLIQVVGRDAEHKNYKGAMIYLLHIDRKSVAAGKRKYTKDALFGPWKEKAVQVIEKYKEDTRNRDNDIILILDYIQNKPGISTADLVRWCCANNLYSVYRRSASIVGNILREYRDNARSDEYIALVGKRLGEAEQSVRELQREAQFAKQYKEIASSSARINMELVEEMKRRYFEKHG